LVAEETELEGEVFALEFDGGVDAGGVALEEVELIGGEGGDGAVGGGSDEEGSLEAVVRDEGGAEDFGEGAGGVAAEGVHLPEAVLCGDEALGEEEVVEVGGAEVGDAVGVALDGDGSRETGDRDGAVESRKGVLHRVAEPLAGDDKADDSEENCQGGDDDGDAAEEATARGLPRDLLRGEGRVRDHIGVCEVGEAHGLIASVNGGMSES
jgi:hypothetical protein